MHYDVIIIGGSYAGLSAALSLGRALRTVLVIDSGEPCNRFSPASHNFLGSDGLTPDELSRVARQQATAYSSVQLLEDTVSHVENETDLFRVDCRGGKSFTASKLLFATGISDRLPEIKGMQECWGKSVMHCPYCDGYELRNQRLAILGNGDEGFELAMFLKHWSKDLVLLTNGKSMLSASQLDFLTSLNIPVLEEEVTTLEHTDGQLSCIRMQNDLYCDAVAMYIKPGFEQHCDLPGELGCTFIESGHIEIDHQHQTSVKGVYAAGDCSSALRSIAQAVAAGNKTGMMIDKALTADKLSEAHARVHS